MTLGTRAGTLTRYEGVNAELGTEADTRWTGNRPKQTDNE